MIGLRPFVININAKVQRFRALVNTLLWYRLLVGYCRIMG